MVAYLAVRNQPAAETELANAQVTARSLAIDLFVFWVSTVEETDAAFATFAQKRVDAVQGTFGMMERAT